MNGKYINKTHTYGKIWMLVTLCLFISVPALICVHLGVSPKINMIAKGLSTVALVFYPTAVLEVLTYSPLRYGRHLSRFCYRQYNQFEITGCFKCNGKCRS